MIPCNNLFCPHPNSLARNFQGLPSAPTCSHMEHFTELSTSENNKTPHRTGHLTEWPHLSLLLYTLPYTSHCTYTEVLLHAQVQITMHAKITPHHNLDACPHSLIPHHPAAYCTGKLWPYCTLSHSLAAHHCAASLNTIPYCGLTAYNPIASLHTIPQPHYTLPHSLTVHHTMTSLHKYGLSDTIPQPHCTPPEASLHTTLKYYCTSPTASLHTTLRSHCNPPHNLSTPPHSLLHTILKPSCLIMNPTVTSLHTTHSLTAHHIVSWHSIKPPQVGRRNILIRPSLLGP